MIELATLALLGLVLVSVFVVCSVVAFVIQGLIWLILLPFRLLFGILFLPLLILKFVLGGLVMLVLLPVLAIATIIGVLAALVAVAVPLLPFVIVAAAVYLLLRNTTEVAVG